MYYQHLFAQRHAKGTCMQSQNQKQNVTPSHCQSPLYYTTEEGDHNNMSIALMVSYRLSPFVFSFSLLPTSTSQCIYTYTKY